jgi:citrate lyase beta subunit
MSVDAGGRIRSALFTPGTDAEKMRKAVTSGADICIFDLEDSVAPGRLDAARDTVARTVADVGHHGRIWVRVHPASTPEMRVDLASLPLPLLGGIVLPKVADEDEIDSCHDAIAAIGGSRPLPVIPIVESARGILNCQTIALARDLSVLALGRFDLAADLGVDPDDRTPALAAARAMIVLASAAAGLLQPLDSPWLKIGDLDGLREAAESGRREGFGGMLLIHPSHISAVNQVFSPRADEVTWAHEIVASAGDVAAAGRGAYTHNGQMVDEAIVRRARAILRDAEAG